MNYRLHSPAARRAHEDVHYSSTDRSAARRSAEAPASRSRQTRRAHALVALSTVLVATSFPAVESIAGELPSSVLTSMRFALAALVFLPLVIRRHGAALLPRAAGLARYALLSAPLVGFFVAMFEALKTTTAVNTAAIFTLVPAFSALFSVLLIRERTSVRHAVALFSGMLGALWVVLRGEPARLAELDFVAGDAWFLLGTAALGLYAVLVKRLHRGEPHELMTFWTLVTGAVWLIAVGRQELLAVEWADVPSRVYFVTGYLAVFTTLITFFLTQYAATVIGPTRSMSYTFWNPALVALMAWWSGGDALAAVAWPGLLLTLVAMLELRRETDSPNRGLALTTRGLSS